MAPPLAWAARRPGFRRQIGTSVPTTMLGLNGFSTSNYFRSAGGTMPLLKSGPWSMGVALAATGNAANLAYIVGRGRELAAGGGGCAAFANGGSSIRFRWSDGSSLRNSASSGLSQDAGSSIVYFYVITHDGTACRLYDAAGQIGADATFAYGDPDTPAHALTVGVRADFLGPATTATVYGFAIGNAALTAGQVASWVASSKASMDVADLPAGNQATYSVRRGLSPTPTAAPSTWPDEKSLGPTLDRVGSLSVIEVTPTWGN